ncbi:hypothetical protein DFA_03027 [Cavenderia fasciculata]|uniref:Uncharacterized protein n=1 Tax=Cavenderia fasciculata TaxID=261658 RepID=F4PGE9_CACFS|nr:uncharacterized protein DFA_03027 [Cavenderia fasciculata]EGG24783.1 hypothetical protein DFA_03027 [Cavenderia fasciculata]|eukprot:XP_004362634.1 hypothetical protein DFA_03027 [Cavenderia fasciculata]
MVFLLILSATHALSIDLSPLLLLLQFNPFTQLLNHNYNLRIEIFGVGITSIKSSVDLPSRQNTELVGQLLNWTHCNRLVHPNSGKCLFNLTLPNKRVVVYPGENNTRLFMQSKTVYWIEGGAESGLLVDGKERRIDLYCRSSILVPQPGHPIHSFILK